MDLYRSDSTLELFRAKRVEDDDGALTLMPEETKSSFEAERQRKMTNLRTRV
jgi:hypothetical protein